MDEADSKKVSQWLGTGSINIFGLPFSGKDTQTKNLAGLLGGTVIAGGDILRSYSDQEVIRNLMSTGELFPTDFYLSIITPYLSQPELANKSLILSSVGRWHGEEEIIMKATTEAGHALKAVVVLELDETEVWQRFETSTHQKDRGFRYDDAAHILEIRLKEFQAKTLPVIEFYRNNKLVVEVDGSLTSEQVTEQIIDRLLKFATI